MTEQAVMDQPKKERKTAQEKNAEHNQAQADSERQMAVMQRQAMAARITNVKYKEEMVHIVYSLTENNADNKIVLSSKDEPHAAFIDALNALAVHAADIIFHVGGEKEYQTSKLTVKGANFNQNGEELHVGITVSLRLDNNKCTTINTPPMPLHHDDPHVAKHTPEAAKAIEALLIQTRAYLGGRRAQGNLFAKLDD